jgi:prepilin-type N-terminal cleavage/methylation domain-containing protein
MRYSKGFTLIEMLVTMSLIVIITSATLLSFRSMGDAFDLDREVQMVAQDIRNAINMTMASEEHTGVVPVGCVVAYGVRFEENKDYYERKVYFVNPDTSNYTSELLEKVELGEVEIIDISSDFYVDIIFYPPHPTTFIGGIKIDWTSRYDDVDIEIGLKEDATNKRTINVNKFGRIEIQ